MSTEKPYVIVGMSGGVDSSVAAYLLLEQGCHVEGLFMKNWEEDGNDHNCAADQDLLDAQSVCLKLGIRLRTINFAQEYWDRVFTYFLEEYKAGRTPNPDILCNREIKFKAFLEHAKSLGCDYIATGHYARRKEEQGEYFLLRSIDQEKDQTYFLYTLGQKQIASSLFPIGDYEKPYVREIATKLSLRNSQKKDSTGICFIGERNFKHFLSQYLPAQPGNIETDEGKIVGKHDGLMYYTLGQRKGIHLGGVKGAKESPWYVVKKDLLRNTLIVAQDHNHPLLLSNCLNAKDLSWVAGHPPKASRTYSAKTRYRQKDAECKITLKDNNNVFVEFTVPQWAVTPGQSIVFYENEICLGGGVIE